MYNDTGMMMIFNTITSTHAGSGTELSYIDLPIQREGHTGYPKIESSTIKGCLRSHITLKNENGEKKTEKAAMIEQIFGKADQGDFASAMAITDARILFFPVKSAKGIFGWVTCPFVLERFFKDYKLATDKDFPVEWEPEGESMSTSWAPKAGCIPNTGSKLSQHMGAKQVVMLEDYTFTVEENQNFKKFLLEFIKVLPEDSITRNMILEHAVILSDDDFAGFVKYSTEVNTRIKIDPKTGTVAGTALFTEEYLPPESILYSLVFFNDSHIAQGEEEGKTVIERTQVKKEFMDLFSEDMIQIGADTTLGKGLVQVKLWEAKENG